MALPNGVATRRITFGPVLDFQGNAVEASVSFTPSTSLVHTASGTPIVPVVIALTTDMTGSGSVILPCTDQSGFTDGQGNNVTNWAYRVTWGYPAGVVSPTPFWLQIPTGDGSDEDLDLMVPLPAQGGLTVVSSAVLSIAGLSGNITADDLTNLIVSTGIGPFDSGEWSTSAQPTDGFDTGAWV